MLTEQINWRPAGALLSLATLAFRALPRAKGAFARLLGNNLCRRGQFMLTKHGAKLAMAPSGMDVYVVMRTMGNSYDYDDFMLCYDNLRPSDTFYDIGANVGYFAVEMAQLSKGDISVFAFEPSPQLATAIADSFALNGFAQAKVFEGLVGNKVGEVPFYVAPSSLHSSTRDDLGISDLRCVSRNMVSIDHWVEHGAPAPDLMKIDVEGAEIDVLRGAVRSISLSRPHIFFEYHHSFDVEERLRRYTEEIAAQHPGYEIYGQHRVHLRQRSTFPLVRISGRNWSDMDSIFVRNMERPTSRPEIFEP